MRRKKCARKGMRCCNCNLCHHTADLCQKSPFSKKNDKFISQQSITDEKRKRIFGGKKDDEEKSIGNDVCSSNGNRHDSMWRGESSRDSGTVRKFPDTGDRNTGCSDRKRRRDSRRSSLNNRFTF